MSNLTCSKVKNFPIISAMLLPLLGENKRWLEIQIIIHTMYA